MAKWYKLPPSLRVTDREYRANIEGINIVFGAVLGFVLAKAEGIPTQDFVLLLILSAVLVIFILYLASSEYRLFYFVLTVAAIGLLPEILRDIVDISVIPYLQPTLAVWTCMVVLVELLPREKPNTESTEEPTQ